MQDKHLVDVNLTSEMKTSFIDYAMSVIVAEHFQMYEMA